MSSFGDRLRKERCTTSLSQEAFGAIGGVKKGAQINYEKGVRKPDLGYLQNIAKIGCDVQYIILGVRSKELLSDEANHLLNLFYNADESIQLAAIAVLESGESVSNHANLPPTGNHKKSK